MNSSIMDVYEAIDTPKRRQIMLNMLYAYEKDEKGFLRDFRGCRSVEWISPKFDDTYYVADGNDGAKIRKKVMEFLRVLKNEGLVEGVQRSHIEDFLKNNFKKSEAHNIKKEMGIIGKINSLWRINPDVVRETRRYFDNHDMVRTAVDLKEVNALIKRLNEHMEILDDVKEVLSQRLVETTRERSRGDIIDVHYEMELCEAKVTWIRADLDLIKNIIGLK